MNRNMKFAGLLIVLALLVGCSGGGGSVKPKETLLKPYSNQYYGIMYPSEFTYTVEKERDVFYDTETFTIYEEDHFRMDVLTMDLKGVPITPNDFDELVNEFVEGFGKETAAKIISSSSTGVASGQPAQRTIFEVERYGEEGAKVLIVATYNKDVFVLMSFITMMGEFAAKLPVFNEIVDTFKFLN